jgi:hypothetical protein
MSAVENIEKALELLKAPARLTAVFMIHSAALKIVLMRGGSPRGSGAVQEREEHAP